MASLINPQHDIATLLQYRFSIAKDTALSEHLRLQLHGEVFNLLNNVNFALPNVTQNSSQFGNITTELDPRILHLTGKFIF